jgi:hypothetical protein
MKKPANPTDTARDSPCRPRGIMFCFLRVWARMRYFAVLISLCLVGCGSLLEATDQDRENKYNAAVSGCGQMQSDPVLWAQCQTEAENLYWGNVSNRDLLSLRQARRAEIASRLQRRQITLGQANVELATMQSQIASETSKRQAEAQSAYSR